MLDSNAAAKDTNLEMTVDDNGSQEGNNERIQKHMSLKVNTLNGYEH